MIDPVSPPEGNENNSPDTPSAAVGATCDSEPKEVSCDAAAAGISEDAADAFRRLFREAVHATIREEAKWADSYASNDSRYAASEEATEKITRLLDCMLGM